MSSLSKSKFPPPRILVGGVVACAVLAALAYRLADSAIGSRAERSDSATYRIAADDLREALRANELSIESQRAGRVLEVSGRAEKISEGVLGGVRAQLRGDVDALLGDDQRKALERVKSGDLVVMQCESAGLVLGSPTLRGCQVVAVKG